MNSIWSVNENEDRGQVSFTKPSTLSKQVEFSEIMMSEQGNAAVDAFQNIGENSSSIDLKNIDQILPTRQNVEKIAAYMQDKINDAFGKADIPSDPAVEFSLDSTGSLVVNGDRPDMDKIEKLFGDNTELGTDMCNFMAMASQMPKFERALEYTLKYQQADSMAEINKLNEEYADLFDGKDHYDTSFTYGSSGLNMNVTYIP